MAKIIVSRVWRHPRVMWTILYHTPVLDPLVILCNSIVCLSTDNEVMSFVAVKKYGRSYELGTVYTYPKYRGKGHASSLIKYAVQRYQPIGLLCKKAMISFYEKLGFCEDSNTLWVLAWRRRLFNIFLQPFRWYPLVSMVYSGKNI